VLQLKTQAALLTPKIAATEEQMRTAAAQLAQVTAQAEHVNNMHDAKIKNLNCNFKINNNNFTIN
jgi:hypothetical protein